MHLQARRRWNRVRRPDARNSVPPEAEDKYLTSAIIREAAEGLSSTHP